MSTTILKTNRLQPPPKGVSDFIDGDAPRLNFASKLWVRAVYLEATGSDFLLLGDKCPDNCRDAAIVAMDYYTKRNASESDHG